LRRWTGRFTSGSPISPIEGNLPEAESYIQDISVINPVAYEYKAGADDEVPALIDSDISPKPFRINWARLTREIYPVKLPKENPIKQGE